MQLPRGMIDFAVYLVVRCAVCVVQAISLDACQVWSRRFGVLAWHGLRLRRRVIEGNLRIAFPSLTNKQRDALAIGMWQHLLLMVAEIAQAPRKLHRTNWREHSAAPEMRTLVSRLLDPRPMVILSGHFGNFELGGYLLAMHGFPTYTVARRLDNPYLDRWVTRFREATGQFMLEKQGVSGQIETALQRGETLVLLGDQYAGDKACWADFFGKPASTHKAVAMFTLSSSAPTAVCGVIRQGAPLHFEMRLAAVVDPLGQDFQLGSVRQLIQWYSRQLESLIRAAPEQYWWVHRRWKGEPRRRRRSAA